MNSPTKPARTVALSRGMSEAQFGAMLAMIEAMRPGLVRLASDKRTEHADVPPIDPSMGA